MAFWSKLLGGALAYSVGAYLVDVPLRRAAAARAARAYADSKGKPLLNVGAGTGATALFGPTLYGDVNVDLAGSHELQPGPSVVTFGDAASMPQFAAGQFGAVLASHILEHLPDPVAAVDEWLRLVGGDASALFIVTPSWWAPHTWFHPGHLWYFSQNNGRGIVTKLRERLGPTADFFALRGV